MDPISIIGAVGAMANIIDAVSKSVRGISELRDRWKEADLNLLSLASQLTALRGALEKIREWMENDLEGDPHHQLVMDLDVTVKCCELLMSKIEMLVGELGDTGDEQLDFTSRVKLIFKGKNIEDVQKLVEQQTGALTLLLTACNCKAISGQRVLLERSSTRKILSRNQLDSASLFVNRDSASFVSKFTDKLSKLSVVFDFDSELFSSKIYQQVLRGSVKEALRRQQNARQTKEASARSQEIDKRILIDKRNSPLVKVALLGDSTAKAQFLRSIKSEEEAHTNALRSMTTADDCVDTGERWDTAIDDKPPSSDMKSAVSEFTFTIGFIKYCLIDVHGNFSTVRKVSHCFEPECTISFFVDLTSYSREGRARAEETELLQPETFHSELFDSLQFFRSVVTSSFKRYSIVLYLYNTVAFQQQLKRLPLENFAPDFDGGQDSQKAFDCILTLFQREADSAGKHLEIQTFDPNPTKMALSLGRPMNRSSFQVNQKHFSPDGEMMYLPMATTLESSTKASSRTVTADHGAVLTSD